MKATMNTRFEDRVPVVLMGDLTLVRPLALAGIPLVLVTDDVDDCALHSRLVRSHLVVAGYVGDARAKTVEALIRLGEGLRALHGKKPPLFCGDDTQLELIYSHRDALAAVFALSLNDADLAWALYDKSTFYPLCERRGILAPRSLDGDSDADLERLRAPLLVKPRRKSDLESLRDPLFGAAAKARIFATHRDLAEHPVWKSRPHDLLVQEYVGGDIASLCSFHGFADEHHRVLASFCGQKLRTFPAFGGESSYIEMLDDESLTQLGHKLVADLELVGPFKIDLLRDPRTGELYTLEVNARFTLWSYLGAMNGVNLLTVAYEHLTGDGVLQPIGGNTSRHRWLSLYRDARAFAEQRARGELDLLHWLWSLANPHNIYEVFAWRDPAPFAHWLRGFLRHKLG